MGEVIFYSHTLRRTLGSSEITSLQGRPLLANIGRDINRTSREELTTVVQGGSAGSIVASSLLDLSDSVARKSTVSLVFLERETFSMPSGKGILENALATFSNAWHAGHAPVPRPPLEEEGPLHHGCRRGRYGAGINSLGMSHHFS